MRDLWAVSLVQLGILMVKTENLVKSAPQTISQKAVALSVISAPPTLNPQKMDRDACQTSSSKVERAAVPLVTTLGLPCFTILIAFPPTWSQRALQTLKATTSKFARSHPPTAMRISSGPFSPTWPPWGLASFKIRSTYRPLLTATSPSWVRVSLSFQIRTWRVMSPTPSSWVSLTRTRWLTTQARLIKVATVALLHHQLLRQQASVLA